MAFVIGSKVYVSGGQNQAALGTDYFGDLWEFDTVNGIWLKKSDFRGGVRYAGVSFTIGNTGYVGTGLDQSGNVKNDLWAYDASTNAWTQKADLPGEGRGYAVGFTADGKGYVGTGLNSGKKPLNDFYRYDPSTNSWTQTASISGARSQAFAFVINNKGYVGNGTGTSNLQMYDPSTNIWIAKAGIPSYTSIGGAAFSINGKGYAGLGMQNTTPDKRVYEYTPSSDTWTALPDMGAVSVGGIGFAVGSTGYFGLGGGYNGTAPGVDVWTYKP
ncbi:hypothetical protein CKK33_06400 [Mucilaginibacter sp. MD40]|uniref:Kelch repeat-containing protein n=1 Tax=Mucilaginibacter sp. MD40 TaxID=2029590 RepID=UPI000BAC6897|nr:kelch repeat-containing protein [Mucilaginibacter sp. MD40]PAW93142.1 hypothetical protein CKK33_06400 [Mucilaginibacter sp. MD40]